MAIPTPVDGQITDAVIEVDVPVLGYDGHIFKVSTEEWPFDNLDDIFEMIEENHELTEQNEFIVSQKVLIPRSAWNVISVMFIVEYASFEDMAKAQKRGTELNEAKYPEEEDRDARGKKFAVLTGHDILALQRIHEDHILQENAKLAK